jgi:hypothetical protein
LSVAAEADDAGQAEVQGQRGGKCGREAKQNTRPSNNTSTECRRDDSRLSDDAGDARHYAGGDSVGGGAQQARFGQATQRRLFERRRVVFLSNCEAGNNYMSSHYHVLRTSNGFQGWSRKRVAKGGDV